jgi:nucleoside-diphosphate-sugar epimerase
MSRFFIFGMGYTASVLATRLRAQGWHVTGTGSCEGALPFTNAPAIHAALSTATHILSSVPPDGEQDPVLTHYAPALSPTRHWLGYLSSTGVYGNTHGAWVDETAPIQLTGAHTRRPARAQADAAWLALGARVFRLPGIYGPAFENLGGRSALDRVRAQTAHRIAPLTEAMPDQIFSRIHVSDIASAILAALATDAPPGAATLAPQNAVIEEACRLLRLPPPPLQTLEEAALTPAARAFYAQNRRVTNLKARRVLNWRPQYPSYREGLAAILGGGV